MAVYKPWDVYDDCTVIGTSIYLDYTYLLIGKYGATSVETGVRFINVTIPIGATILTAKVTFQAESDRENTVCNAKIKGEANDDPSIFSTYDDFIARPRTTAYVDWNDIPDWYTNTDHDSPDLKDIIQEIVNQAGWASGNHLVLFFADNASSYNAYRNAKSVENSTTLCARLTVTWSAVQHYTLTAGAGTYTKTGQGAGLKAARKIPAEAASYSLAGQTAALRAARKVVAEAGSYSLTGQLAALRAARRMAALSDSYALTGQAVALKLARKIPAGPGSYLLTGQDAVLRAARKLAAAAGSYALVGQDANLVLGHHYILVAEAGSYGEPYSKIFVTLDGRIYKKMGDTYLRIG